MKKLIVYFGVFIILAGCSITHKSKFEFYGQSMLPTIKNKQVVLVDKNYYKRHSVKRGDIIVFRMSEDKMHIKRVVGLPNDFLQIKEDTVFINNNPINPKFIFNKVKVLDSNDQLSKGINLKKDEYFVIGDNAPNSIDSRRIGPINKSDIIGKVVDLHGN